MQNRDFKGVWIPKEIWLSEDLSMIEKGILTEIASLDNENHCIAGNDYFAEFCQCSVTTVTRAIKHLIELNYIEQVSFDGRHRVLKLTNQTRQIDEADSSICKTNNIYNNTNNNGISKDIPSDAPSEFQFGKSETKKPNLYQKCISLINNYTEDCKIRQFLKNYLDLCMEMKCIRGANQWKGMLNTLDRVSNGSRRCDIIQNSIDHGWKTFYPLNQNDFKNKKDFNVKRDIEMIEENDYDKYDHTKSERSF